MAHQEAALLIGMAAALVLVLAAVLLSGLPNSMDLGLTPNTSLPFAFGEPKPTVAGLPDLTTTGVSITLEDPACYDGESMGLRATIANIGLGFAGAFVVEIDGTAALVDGLAGGASTSIWLPGYSQEPSVVVDATDLVVESNEDNNVFHELVPVPTLPPPCAVLTDIPS